MLFRSVPPADSQQTLRIVSSGDNGEYAGTVVTDVQITGVSVRFRAEVGGSADCALDAVPARGYKGTCALAAGDTAEFTLIPPVAGMMLPAHEVRLARDAAPPHIARAASVFVLGPAGYAEAVRGTNGFTCFIERPTVNDIWPICHNREGAERLLPVERYRARLRVAGVGDAAITDSVLRAYREGRFRAPTSGALGYMLSRYAWTASAKTGAPIFLGPHLHFYAPATTNARIGVMAGERPAVAMRVEREGRPDASVIVGVRVIDPPAAQARP